MDRKNWDALTGGERWGLLLAHTPDLVSIHDPYGLFIAVSASWRDLLGHEPEALLGTQPYDLMPPEDHETVLEAHRSTLYDDDASLLVQYRLRHADGRLRWFESSSRTVSLSPGGPRIILVVSRCIDSRPPSAAGLVPIDP